MGFQPRQNDRTRYLFAVDAGPSQTTNMLVASDVMGTLSTVVQSQHLPQTRPELRADGRVRVSLSLVVRVSGHCSCSITMVHQAICWSRYLY